MASEPVRFDTVCPWCGALLDSYELADAGGRWMEPVLWGYVAQAAHNREQHPATAAAQDADREASSHARA